MSCFSGVWSSGGRLTVDVDAEGAVQLDIQPAKKSDKPKTEPATTS